MDTNYGFWLYSAMTQATAALFGVIGMFIIYKLQSLKNANKEGERGVLNTLHRVRGIRYEILERINFEEVEEMFDKEIESRQKIVEMPDEDAKKNAINKQRNKNELHLLQTKKLSLKSSRDNFDSLVQNGKKSMAGLGFIFVFSIALLMAKPFLEKIGFVSITIIYVASLLIVFLDIGRLMKKALTLIGAAIVFALMTTPAMAEKSSLES